MISLLIPSLLLGLGSEPSALNPPAPSATIAASTFEGVQELIKEYDTARSAWLEKINAADEAERMQLFDEAPAADFWSRFVDFADEGDPQATVWVIQHAQDVGLRPDQLKERVLNSYKLLLFDYNDNTELLEEACSRLKRLAYALPRAELAAVLSESFSMTETKESKALCGFYLGELLVNSEKEKMAQEGLAWLRRVQADFPESPYAVRAADLIFAAENLVVGAIAPDFGGQSIDGDEIKLSDYRGKIVVVDFFGFW